MMLFHFLRPQSSPSFTLTKPFSLELPLAIGAKRKGAYLRINTPSYQTSTSRLPPSKQHQLRNVNIEILNNNHSFDRHQQWLEVKEKVVASLPEARSAPMAARSSRVTPARLVSRLVLRKSSFCIRDTLLLDFFWTFNRRWTRILPYIQPRQVASRYDKQQEALLNQLFYAAYDAQRGYLPSSDSSLLFSSFRSIFTTRRDCQQIQDR